MRADAAHDLQKARRRFAQADERLDRAQVSRDVCHAADEYIAARRAHHDAIVAAEEAYDEEQAEQAEGDQASQG